nr:VWA domain-containing protein [Candidatus Poribacteria bacterium]
MRKRRDMETFNLSFLDVVCCGFGAVILLLVITKIYEPVTIQKSQEELQNLIVSLQQELNLIRGEST